MGVKGLWRALKDEKKYFQSAEELEPLLRELSNSQTLRRSSRLGLSGANRCSPHFVIDGMVILLAIWHRDGYGTKCFLARGDLLVDAAAEIANKMREYLDFLPQSCSREWVFDGSSPEAQKLRAENLARTRAKKIGQAVRRLFLPTNPSSSRLAKSLLNRFAMPSRPIVQAVIQAISETANVLLATGEADYAIAKHISNVSRKGKPTIVVSSDSDYIAFTECNAILNPIKR